VGARIKSNITGVMHRLERNQEIEWVGGFVQSPDGVVRVRSRASTGIPGDRIPPDEYDLAVREVLTGGAMDAERLKAEVRSRLGFNRTGEKLDGCIDAALGRLLSSGVIGHASAGLALRSRGGGD
jgi:hypothetical protein